MEMSGQIQTCVALPSGKVILVLTV